MGGSFSWKDVGTGDRINDFSDTEIENAVTDSNIVHKTILLFPNIRFGDWRNE